MANDVNSMVAAAKGTLAHAEKSFPSSGAPKATPTPAPAKSAAVEKPKNELQQSMMEKSKNIANYVDANALPKLHDGGPVAADGPYMLKAGEHVLTAPQAKMARRHAMLAIGMKGLTQPKTAGEPTAQDVAVKKPEKTISGITVRSEKNQAKKDLTKTPGNKK